MNFIVFGIVMIFVVIVIILGLKRKKECDEMVSKLTEEQKNILMSTEVNFVEKNAWVQKAMVAKINGEYNTITIADVSITKSEQEEHNLKEGDFVKFYFAPEKNIGRTKIIWD